MNVQNVLYSKRKADGVEKRNQVKSARFDNSFGQLLQKIVGYVADRGGC